MLELMAINYGMSSFFASRDVHIIVFAVSIVC